MIIQLGILLEESKIFQYYEPDCRKNIKLLNNLEIPEKQDELLLKIFKKYTNQSLSDSTRLALGELLNFATIKSGEKDLEDKKHHIIDLFIRCYNADYIHQIGNPKFVPRFKDDTKVQYLYIRLTKILIPELTKQMRMYIYKYIGTLNYGNLKCFFINPSPLNFDIKPKHAPIFEAFCEVVASLHLIEKDFQAEEEQSIQEAVK